MDRDHFAAKYPDYHFEDRSVAITALPGWVWGLTIILAAIPLALFAGVAGRDAFDMNWQWLVLTVILLLMHEGTHAVAWKLSSGLPWSSFTFGVQWKTATPYCHSTEPMGVRAYRIGALMPLIVTGIVPWIIAMILKDANLAIASALLISGAAGDLYILWSIKDLPDGVLLQDHDEKAGCVVLWPQLPRGPANQQK